MTRTRRPSPHTPSVDGQNEGSNRSMTKKKNTPAQRVGAAALATATVVSGLAFGPGAVAAPASDQNGTSAGSPSVSSSAESTRLVGPLAIVVSETVAYGLRADADTMRTLSAGNLEHAQAEADYWSVPAVGEVGPVRGVGEDSERCLLKSGTPTNAGIVLMATCDGSAAQNWQWTDITTMQGFSKGLSPAAETSRAIGSRGAGSFVHAVTGSFRHPMALDDAMKAERELTASATGVPGQISGVGTTGATVSARGESVVVSDDGTYTLSLPGLSTAPTSVEVTQTLPNGDVQDTVDVEVTGTGPLAPVEMAPVEVARGGERAVTFEAKVADELLSRPAAEVTLTAPEGMTFAEGQDEITGAYIRDGRPSPGGMQLTAGERSADGRTYTYTWDTVANGATGWQSPQDEILRWQIAVVTPSDAADVDGNTMGYSLVGTSTQGAFEATGAAPVSVVDEFGTITGVEVAPTVLQRGEDTAVSFVVENTEARSALNPTVTLTAPEGTTFAPDTTVEAEWRTTGTSTWNNGGNMRMTDVTISDDGRTLTGTKASGTVGSPQEFKFTVMVSTAADAADVADNALGFVYRGTSSAGAFHAAGTAPVSITGDAGDFSAVEVEAVELDRGAETEVSGVVETASDVTSMTSKVMFTAPEGTTFADADDRVVPWQLAGESEWRSSDRFGLRNGVLSSDASSVTYDLDATTESFDLPAGSRLKLGALVSTPLDAEGPEGLAMSFVHVGTSNAGAFHATGAAPVSIPGDFGSIAAVEVAPTVLQRGEDTAVSFVVENTEARSALNPTVTLTAPEGTTFAPDTTVEAEWRTTGTSTWNNGGNMRMTDVTISDDGRTLTGTKASGTVGSPQEFKFTVMVSTAADAADVADNALGFVYEGTSSAGAFRATGTAPVSIAGDFGGFTSVDVESTSLTPGARGELSFVVENDSAREGFAPVVTLTAPEGVTFASESLIRGEYRYIDDEAWNEGLNLRLTDISISDDGRTLTGTRAATNVGGGQHFRYTAAVQVADDAAVGPTSGMGFVYEGTSSTGAFHTAGTAPVSIVQAYAPVTLDNFGDGDTFTPGDVTFSGTGTPGATVTVAPSTGVGVSTEVRSDGTWSAVRYLGNAAYTMSVSQTAASGENTIQNIRLFSDAVVEQDFSVTSPAAGAGHTQQGWVTFTGQGTTWSTVSISDGSDVPATTATVQYDGTWSARRWVGTEKTTFTVTSSRADVQNGSQTIEFNTGVSGQEFSLDSHTDGGTFTPGNVTFRGKGSTGDEVTFTAPGLAPMEATVNAAGEWSVPRWLGNGFITFTVTHTPVTGDATQQTLRLFSDQVAQGDLTVTAPLDGAGHDQPGWVTFTGTGTTWSTVSISDGTTAAPSTATVQYDGSWTVNRWVGTAPTTFTVSSERAGIAQGSETIEFNAGESDGEFAISSHTDGGTFTPGNVTIAGTGTAGDEVTLSAAGLAPIEIEVDERGYWSTSRWLGNGFISFTVTHTPVSGAETTHTLRLYSDQVAQGDLTVTSPLDGASHTAAGFVTFTGTGTTWSKVSVSDGTNAAPSVATVQYDGSWTVRRWVGTDPVTFTVTSERADIANGSETIRFNTAD